MNRSTTIAVLVMSWLLAACGDDATASGGAAAAAGAAGGGQGAAGEAGGGAAGATAAGGTSAAGGAAGTSGAGAGGQGAGGEGTGGQGTGGQGTGGQGTGGQGTAGAGAGGGSGGAGFGEADKRAAMKVVMAKQAELMAAKDLDIAAKMVELMKGLPVFTDAGSTQGGGAWGAFWDGQIAWVVTAPLDKAAATPAPVDPPSLHSWTVPSGKDVYLVQGFDKGYNPDGWTTVLKLDGLLKKRGYKNVAAEGQASVEALRALKTYPLFYFNTHGDGETVKGTKQYCLYTTSEPAPLVTPDLQEDIKKGRLGVMSAAIDEDDNGKPVIAERYCITPTFVADYVELKSPALVWLNACLSGGDVAAPMRQAFMEHGADVVVGWSDYTAGAPVLDAAALAFDRMLGTNQIKPATPNNRPRDWQDAQAAVAAAGLDHKVWTDAMGVAHDTQLFFDASLDDSHPHLKTLTPSIRTMQVWEKADHGELHISGQFGDDPGQAKRHVYVSGQEVPVPSWNDDEITALLPLTGATAAGDVQVVANEHASNVVPLTLYHGTVTRTQTGEGTTKFTLTSDLSFRVDLHKVRDALTDTPHYPDVDNPSEADGFVLPRFQAMANSKTVIAHSGMASGGTADCPSTTVVSGGGSLLTVPPPGSTAPSAQPSGYFRADMASLYLSMGYKNLAPYTETVTSCKGTMAYQQPVVLILTPAIDIPSFDLSIPAGSLPADLGISWSWTDIVPDQSTLPPSGFGEDYP